MVGKYRTIVADPPWPFTWSGGPGGRRRKATPLAYPLMTVKEIKALPVGDLATKNAHLYLWVTPQMNREGEGVKVAQAWGFKVVGEIIWRKPNFGAGHFPRSGHEPLLVCRRGKLPFALNDVHSVQTWAQRYDDNHGKRHSAKPEGALDLIERASLGPYLELFARRNRIGWDTWGNEALEHVEIA